MLAPTTPPLLGQCDELFIRLVAAVVAQGVRIGVGKRDRFLRCLDRVHRRFVADVRKVDQHAETVHLFDHLQAEAAQPSIGPFQTSIAYIISLHVRQLNHPNSERLEDREQTRVVFDGCGVLKT